MTNERELETLGLIDQAFSKLEDHAARDRVLRWAWDKYSTKPIPSEQDETSQKSKKTRGSTRKVSGVPKKRKKKGPTLVKELNLRPKGGKTFRDFVAEKAPAAQHEQCVVAVYYLLREAQVQPVTIDHIYTCFKESEWRLPADLSVRLAWVASQKGWLDTSSMDDIKLTPSGENLVEHDLPKKPRDTKKK